MVDFGIMDIAISFFWDQGTNSDESGWDECGTREETNCVALILIGSDYEPMDARLSMQV